MPWSDPQTRKEYHQRYYLANKRKWPERYNKKTPEQKVVIAKKMRDYILRKNYGITLDEYRHMLESQGGKCAICGTASQKGRGVLHVDHCHSTGKVRKLLCVTCNMSLGVYETFKDQAEKYLKQFVVTP